MWGVGRGNHIDVFDHINYPHSLGIYYTAFTQFLGLPNYGDEYKLMGLAAYGEPTFLPQLREVLVDNGALPRLNLSFFTHHTKGVDMTWGSGPPEIAPMWSAKMEEVFGKARERGAEVTDRDRDLAASVQARLEEVELAMLSLLGGRSARSPQLVMAGGVALNCVANARITSETPFEEVWIQPASTDDGTAIGAALWVAHQVLGLERSFQMTDVFLGPSFSQDECDKALDAKGLTYRQLSDEDLFEHVATRIASGAIVGWFDGAMEFGPRALGNRSIVCDPRRADMKDILNSRIKHREPFRPFAPSILSEKTGEWFEESAPSPFMLMAYPVKPERRNQIPAVTHEDGTSRLQTVDAQTHPRYHALISAFERQTGVPVLLNTSFNENEPICCTPEEAVETFTRTRMDLLVLGNLVSERDSGS
jgi:carbamoyltransferase